MSGSTIGSLAGAAIGFAIGGPAGARWGYLAGGLIGGYISPTVIKGPSIGDAQKQTSQAGVPRPVVFGHPAPFAGNLIDGETVARKVYKKVKNGKGAPTVTKEAHFLLTSGIRICEGPIAGIVRVKRNGKPVYDVRPLEAIPGFDGPDAAKIAKYHSEMQAASAKWLTKARFYLGDETQLPDPALEVIHGVGNTPYYRGTAYMVVENDDVTDLEGACAQYEFEVLGSATTQECSDGNVYVANDVGSGASYYIVDATAATATNGGTLATCNYPTINADQSRLYLGQLGATYCGFVALPSGTPTYFASAKGMMLVDATETYAYCCTVLGNQMRKIRISDGVELSSTDIDPGGSGELADMCWSLDGTKIYIAMYSNDAIFTVFDVADLSVINYDTTPNRRMGRGIAVDPTGEHVYIPCQNSSGLGNYLTIIKTDDGTIFAEISLPGSAGAEVAFSPDGTRYAVASYSAGDVWVYAVGSNTLLYTLSVPASLTKGISWNLSGRSFFVASDNALYIYETDGYTLADTVSLSGNPYGVSVWPPCPAPLTWERISDVDGAWYDTINDVVITTACVDKLADNQDVTLRYVEEQIAARCNVPSGRLDFSALTDIIPGYLIAEQHTGAECLQPLMAGFFHDLPEFDNKIRAVYRGGAAEATITDDDLIDGSDDDKLTEAQALEYPLKVSVVTQEPEADYAPVPQTSARFSPDVIASSEVSVQLPIPFDADTAMQCAHKVQKVLWAQAEGKQDLTLPDQWSWLVPSSAILKGGKRWMVMQADTADGVTSIKADYDRVSAYTSTLTGKTPDPGTPTGTGLVGPTLFAAMNLPQLRTADNVPGMYIAACGQTTGWAGADILLSVDGGASFVTLMTITKATTMGRLTADCTSSSEPISVRMYGGTLATVTVDQIAAKANAFAILSAANVAEIGQFQTATQTATDYYDLTDITRGELGTTANAHLARELIVMLDDVYFVPLDLALSGQTIIFKAVSLGALEGMSREYSVVFDPGDFVEDGGTPG